MTVTPLERSSHVALYQQIAERLASDIQERRFRPFERLPSEIELMKSFDVSRVTLRQAIDLLVRRGLVVRKQGKGTFVAGPALDHQLHELRGIYETIEAAGLDLRTRLIEFEPRHPPADIRELLGGRGPLMRMKRLYRVDEAPLGLIVCWFPPAASSLRREDAETHTVYGMLGKLRLGVDRADLTIGGRQAGRSLGKLLGCPSTSPLLVLERVSYEAGVPCEKSFFFVRSDNYRFTLRVHGPVPLAGNFHQSG